MVDIQLPPFVSALCTSCETICERECCGINAFNFSPFNIIYHLTKWDASILDSEVEAIRSELADLSVNIRSSDQLSEKVVLKELNAIFSVEQLYAIIREIDSALTEACSIYASQKTRVDERCQKLLRIINSDD